MAQHTGHWVVDTSSYDALRNEVLWNGWDWDGSWGDQCWDLCQLLWWSVGKWILQTGPNGSAYECWTVSRDINTRGGTFQAIYDKNQIKRGDVVVFSGGPFGHIAFADEDYVAGRGYITCVGQNQGGTPYWAGGSECNVARVAMNILGAFRYTAWHTTPPTPPPTPPTPPGPSPIKPVGFIPKKSTYPWVTMWRYNEK